MPRPAHLNPDTIWPTVLGHIANGDALSNALRRVSPSPSYSWAKAQLRRSESLREAYQEAIRHRADALAQDIIEIADAAPPSHLTGDQLQFWISQQKLKLHARQWVAARQGLRRVGT